MSNLLASQDYYELPSVKRLISLRRKDIVDARLKLANHRALSDTQRDALWRIVDNRELFLRMVAKDYSAELELIDRALEAELSR